LGIFGGVMNQESVQMKGFKFKLRNWRFCINTRGIDISNGKKGAFLFHPFTKQFSFKQYYGAYKWIFTDDIKPMKHDS
jgi:hypothetical protein